MKRENMESLNPYSIGRYSMSPVNVFKDSGLSSS